MSANSPIVAEAVKDHSEKNDVAIEELKYAFKNHLFQFLLILNSIHYI